VITTPKVGERFTEFYILGTEGEMTNYPRELLVGEVGKVILGVVNYEHEPAGYRVDIVINGTKGKEIGPFMLGHNEKWEGDVTFTLDAPGNSQKIEFQLYKRGETVASLILHLWVNVSKLK
jgi:uncharacterized membrane protein